MERLTAIAPNGRAYLVKVKPNEQEVDSPYPNTLKAIMESFQKLAEYEIAEEQGILIKQPCNLGDVVYANRQCFYIPHQPRWYGKQKIQDCEVIGFKRTKSGDKMLLKPIHTECYVGRGSNKWFSFGSIGKTVFLDKVLAEEKLHL